MRTRFLPFIFFLALALPACRRRPHPGPPPSQVQAASSPPAAKIEAGGWLPNVREGFEVSKWADVPDARSLAVSPDGKTVFVGSLSGWISKVTVNESGPQVERFLDNLEGSNGVCFDGDDLLVGELRRVRRFAAKGGFKPGDEGTLVLDGFPAETHHGWRYMKVGPDHRVYMGIGAPCNVCERDDDPRFATLSSFTTEGKDFRIEAKGVRNTVGFDWQPETNVLFFTDNGRDMLGDDIPPDELNRLPEEARGGHFGFPYRWGDNQPDPEFGDKAPPLDFIKPFHKFKAHVAALGCLFPREESNKAKLPNQILVCQHGSWNRSTPIGYRVVTVDLQHPEKEAEPLLWGFLQDDGGQKGRPVDVAELPDGTILVSDDEGGVLWAVRTKR